MQVEHSNLKMFVLAAKNWLGRSFGRLWQESNESSNQGAMPKRLSKLQMSQEHSQQFGNDV